MNTNFLLSLLTAIGNRFKTIEADLTNKAVDTEKQIADLYNVRKTHLEEAAKASRVGRALQALLTPTPAAQDGSQDVNKPASPSTTSNPS